MIVGDNYFSETFFGRLKEKLVPRGTWQDRAALIASVNGYIRGFHNPRRRPSRIAFCSALDYEVRTVGQAPVV